MNLYLRARSPYWWADVTVNNERHRFPTKRRHLFPEGTTTEPKRLTKAQAEAKRQAEQVVHHFVKERLDRSQLGVLEEITLKEATDRYLIQAKRQKDYRNVQGRVRKLIGELPGRYHLPPDMKLHEVTTAVVERLREKRLEEGNKEGTINLEVQVLQRIYNLASKKWGVRTNPDTVFEKFKTNSKLRWLTLDEERRLLAELDPRREVKYLAKWENRPLEIRRKQQDQYDLVIFLLDTGARYSEVAEITWDAVDTREWKIINIYRSKVGNEGNLGITKRLKEVLQRRWAERRNSPYIFPGYRDALKPRGHATGGIRKAIKRAGLNAPHLVDRYGTVTVHTFRDTFASRLVQKGVSLYKVQQLLGHASPQMTQKYAHLAPNQAADEAVAVLDRIHEGSVGYQEEVRP